MFGNVFYQSHIYSIGGVETFLYELARLSYDNNRDLTIIYRTGDHAQIHRLKRYCRVLSLSEVSKPIRCKKAFFNYNIDAIDYFEADEYIQMVHGDFKDKHLTHLKIIQSDKIDRYFAVSENSAKSFRELTNHDIGVMYNPITVDEEPRVLTLVSAQRLTSEKGVKRLEEMVRRLDATELPFVWHIFSNGRLSVESENVMYHAPTLDIRRWVKYADYMVLLSDTEGFPYGAYESLCLGTPLIITKLPILNELGATTDNSIVVDFDLSNLDVSEIYRRAGTFNFSYRPKEPKWLEELSEESTYVVPTYVKIQATHKYIDTETGETIPAGKMYEVTEGRAEVIVKSGYAVYV